MTDQTHTAPHVPIDLLTVDPKSRVALRGLRVRSRLTPLGHETTFEQTFVNLEDQAIEAVYTFPLPDKAAVCGMEVRTGEHILTGTVEEIGNAIEKHEQAMADGHGSTLLEQHRPDVFTVSLGSLKPRQAATVLLRYICEVQSVDKLLRVSFPTTLAPRYATATGSDPVQAQMDGDILNPPHVLNVPYGLTLEFDIDLGRTIAAITCPTHAVRIEELAGNRRRITLAAGATKTDCDLVFEIQLADEPRPTAVAATGPDGAMYVGVTFVPEFADAPVESAPADIIFLVDCSGSMEGTSIEQARTALALCLRSLREGDRFNICRFGNKHEWMSIESLVYSPGTLKKALDFVERMDADLGGTEIYPPLAEICGEIAPGTRGGYFAHRQALRHAAKDSAGPRVPSAEMQVVVLTDGQVSNEPAVVELVGKHRDKVRIFSFGIGAATSAYLVRGMAESTGGAAEFIAPGERIEEKVLRTFSRMGGPMVRDVGIAWGGTSGVKVSLAPETCPTLFEGDGVTLVGRVESGTPEEFSLSCRVGEQAQSWRVRIPAATEDGGALARLWARRTMDGLERQRRSQRDELVQLSKRFGILCSETAMIAIEHRSLEDRAAGHPALRRVPVQLARGWHGVEAMVSCLMAAPAAGGGSIRRRRSFAGPMQGFQSLDKAQSFFQKSAPSAGQSESLACRAEASMPTGAGGGNPLLDLLARQQAQGWFEMTGLARSSSRLSATQERAVDEFLESFKSLPADMPAKVRATLMALVLFRTQFRDQRRLWLRAAAKAVDFVARATGKTAAEIKVLLEGIERS